MIIWPTREAMCSTLMAQLHVCLVVSCSCTVQASDADQRRHNVLDVALHSKIVSFRSDPYDRASS